MDFDYARTFGNRPSTGYERLLYECMLGDATLFQRADMAELGWSVVAPVQEAWARGKEPLPEYPAGSMGPDLANEMLALDGRHWRKKGRDRAEFWNRRQQRMRFAYPA